MSDSASRTEAAPVVVRAVAAFKAELELVTVPAVGVATRSDTEYGGSDRDAYPAVT
jgi:hypothetical protein